MKRKYLLLGSITVLLGFMLLSGCSKESKHSNPPAPQVTKATAADYFPTTPGSNWDYAGEGNEYAAFKSSIPYAKNNLIQVSQSNGGTVMTIIYKVSDEDIRIVYREGESYNPPNMLENGFTPNEDTVILKTPLKTGTTWQNGGTTLEIAAVGTNLTTPAGDFKNCLKIKATDANSTVYTYYGKGIGLLKREFVSGDATIRSILKAYKIK